MCLLLVDNFFFRPTKKLKRNISSRCSEYQLTKFDIVKVLKKVRKMINLTRDIQFQFVLSWNNEFSLFIPSDKKDKKAINFHVNYNRLVLKAFLLVDVAYLYAAFAQSNLTEFLYGISLILNVI